MNSAQRCRNATEEELSPTLANLSGVTRKPVIKPTTTSLVVNTTKRQAITKQVAKPLSDTEKSSRNKNCKCMVIHKS